MFTLLRDGWGICQIVSTGDDALAKISPETGYPLRKRPFYTHPDPDRPGYSNSFDLLFRGLEIVTGGQRLHIYSDYLRALESRGMDCGPFEGYLKAFRHGMPPHGGFGMGLERFVAQLLGLSNVRETALFPRTMNRMQP